MSNYTRRFLLISGLMLIAITNTLAYASEVGDDLQNWESEEENLECDISYENNEEDTESAQLMEHDPETEEGQLLNSEEIEAEIIEEDIEAEVVEEDTISALDEFYENSEEYFLYEEDGETYELYAASEEITYSGQCGDNMYWTLDSAGTLNISGTGAMYNYSMIGEVVPKEGDMRHVEDNAPWLWENNHEDSPSGWIGNRIKKIIIEEGVTSIGTCAFSYAGEGGMVKVDEYGNAVNYLGKGFLSTIELPSTLQKIGNNAFAGTGCNELIIPDSVNTIESQSLDGMTTLRIVFGSGITSFAGVYFRSDQLQSVVLPDNLVRIGARCFSGCSSLKQIDVPNTVVEIEQEAFENSGLESITMPDDLEKIGSQCFAGCIDLKEIEIPERVTEIGAQAFWNSGLEEVIFSGGAPAISNSAFMNDCISAYIPFNRSSWSNDTLKNYGGTITWYQRGTCGDNVTCTLDTDGILIISGTGKMYDFSDWDVSGSNSPGWRYSEETGYHPERVKEVIVESGVTNIGCSAFRDLGNLTRVSLPETIVEIGSNAFLNCGSLSSISLPDSLQTIGMASFGGCGLERITIPRSVSFISMFDEYNGCYYSAFVECTSLESIDVVQDNSTYSSFDGALYNDDLTELLYCPQGKVGLIFASGITKIGEGAFKNNTMEDIVLPDGIQSIKHGAFHFCRNLTSITIPNSVQEIGRRAFEYCSSLQKISIPSRVPSIQYCCFNVCTSLKEIWFNGDAVAFGDSCFSSVTTVAYYPSNNNTWNEEILKNYGGTVTWLPYKGSTIALSDLTYSFSNSFSGFSYPSDYRIKLAIYQKMFGVTALADTLFLNHRNWGGNCYGMSSTAGIMNNTYSGLKPVDFKTNAERIFDLGISDISNKIGLTVRDFIECMHVSQYDVDTKKLIIQNRDDINEIADLSTKVASTGEPVLICIYGNEGGHAIVGYDLEQIDGSTAHLHVYDCNFPNTERYITLRGTEGNYTSWHYLLNNRYNWGTGYAGSWISYIPYSWYEQSWNNRGHLQENMNLVATNSNNMQIKDVEENVIAEIKDGELITDRDDIYQVSELGLPLDGLVGDTGTMVYIPSNRLYMVENKDLKVEKFEVSMTNIDLRAMVTTDSDTVALAVNDNTKLNEVSIDANKGQNYQIEMMSTVSDDPYSNIVVNGICQNSSIPVEVSIVNGKPVMNMTDEVSLMIDGRIEYDTLTKPNSQNETERETQKEAEKETENESHIHKWDNGKQTKEATVQAEGEVTYTCTICGEKKIEKTKKIEPKILLNVSSIQLKTKQSTKLVKVSGLAKGDSVAAVRTSNKKIVTGKYHNGLLTVKAGKKTGKAKITITLKSGKTAQLTVKVQKKKVTTSRINGIKKTLSLSKGQKVKLTPSVQPITSTEKIKYSSSNKKVVKVDGKGNVKALKKGKAVVTVKSGKKIVKCKITVK